MFHEYFKKRACGCAKSVLIPLTGRMFHEYGSSCSALEVKDGWLRVLIPLTGRMFHE